MLELPRLGLFNWTAAVLALTAVVLCAPATAAVTTIGHLGDPAAGLTVGPDGRLWHTSAGKVPRVGRTTVAGVTKEVALPDAGAKPGAITRGPDGTLWFIDATGEIDRVSLAGAIDTVAAVPGTPTALTAGPDGNVWVTLPAKGKKDDGAIGRVTPAGVLSTFTTGLTADPGDIAAGWDGALWFTEPEGNAIGRITTAGVITEYPAAKEPAFLAAGADGAVWFTARKTIGRITTSGTVRTVKTTGGGSPGDIALGADGALWYTRSDGIGHITPWGAITNLATPDLRPGTIVLGADHAIWFTDRSRGVLGRIAADAAPAAAPVLGKSFLARPAHGTVRYRPPGADQFRTLDTRTSLPVGSVLDAHAGRVAVRSELPSGQTQLGLFHGSRFSVRQPRHAGGLTRLTLRGRLDCADASTARKRRKHRRRRLWGTDDGGLFATLGDDSVTTVRGTKWLTEDRCSGTLTRVVRGSVVVRERATGRRSVLHAGEHHFARHRP
jgi:virginiamycin B lyase